MKQIHQKLKGHGLAEFVGHLLNLMGYKTRVSEPGPDRGIDIMAHKDNLGVTPPTIIVQVKSGEGDVNEAAVSELSGKVSEKDFGLFVSAAGFNKRARDFAFAKRNLKLIDGDELVELVYKYYSQLDARYKGMIPLRSVYIPETLTEQPGQFEMIVAGYASHFKYLVVAEPRSSLENPLKILEGRPW